MNDTIRQNMEEHDLNACKIADFVKTDCQGNQDNLGEALMTSDSYGKYIDANSESVKKGIHGTSCREVETLSEMETSAVYDESPPPGFSAGYKNCVKAQSSGGSSSRSQLVDVGKCKEIFFGETKSLDVPSTSEVASLTDQRNLADGELRESFLSSQSPEEMNSDEQALANGYVNSETRELLHEESDRKNRMKGCSDVAGTDCSDPLMQSMYDKKIKTESSNSVHSILDSSSDSSLEASVSGKPCRQNTSSTNSFSCPGPQSSLEEPSLNCTVSGTDLQTANEAALKTSVISPGKQAVFGITSERVDNLGNSGSEVMIVDHSTRVVENIVTPMTNILKRSEEHLYPNKLYDSSELNDAFKVDSKREVEQNENREVSDKALVDMSPLDGHLSLEARGALNGPSLDEMSKNNDDSQKQGPSRLPSTSKDISPTAQAPYVCEFDLNDDIFGSGEECTVQPVKTTVSTPIAMPIAVLAKCGVPMPLPTTRSFSGGEVGWKGSAETSAFRATLSKGSNKPNEPSCRKFSFCSEPSRGYTGIDLNVAAEGDDVAPNLFLNRTLVPLSISGDFSSTHGGSEQVDRLSFDLNCLSETDENSQQSYWPLPLSKHRFGGFDLNDSPSIAVRQGTDCDTDRRTQLCINRRVNDGQGSSVNDRRQFDLNGVRSSYWENMSNMQSFLHSHSQPFLVAATNVHPPLGQSQKLVPIQPKPTYTPSQPHVYPYNERVHVGSTDPLLSTLCISGDTPYVTDPRQHAFFHQMTGPGNLPNTGRTSHFTEAAIRPPSGHGSIAGVGSRFDVNNGVNSSERQNRELNMTRQQLLVPVSDECPMKSFHQIPLPAMPLKRGEPDGGWDSYQLRHRQLLFNTRTGLGFY